jgi:hypothetical protein
LRDRIVKTGIELEAARATRDFPAFRAKAWFTAATRLPAVSAPAAKSNRGKGSSTLYL